MTSQEAPQPRGLPPQVLQMWSLMYGLIQTQALYVMASLGIADLLTDGPEGAEALASKTGCHAPSLSRVLRLLGAMGLLNEESDGRYSLTSLGNMLRGDTVPSARAGAVFYGSPFIWSAWGRLLDTVRTGETAFEVAHDAPLWDFLAAHPEALRVNTDFMTEMARPRFGGATAGYAFPEQGTVIDVGGGEGTMLIDILQLHPGLRGVLFELPEVAGRARSAIEAAGLASRCEIQGGSFFEGVPGDGDVYVLSNILHDWDDPHSLRILRNCRNAMREGARLLILDAVLPDRDPPFTLAALDLQMMVVVGGKQRTESEMREILRQAGFAVTQFQPPGLMEAIAT